jgi:hypothetical protein
MKRGAVAAIAACFAGALAATPVSARVHHDPCGSNHAAHVEGNLHCGRVFDQER